MPEATAAQSKGTPRGGGKQEAFKDKDKPTAVRMSNITAAKGKNNNPCSDT